MTKPKISFIQFMHLVLNALAAANVEYLIGGAVAVWAWGQPRTTQDFDLVINLPLESVYPLSQELQKRDMLVPFDVILDLMITNTSDLPINAIHLYSGFKAEMFLLRPEDLYRKTALLRRRLVTISPEIMNVYVHAPEDLIINKLRYYQLSEQPKHMRDIASILEAMGAELDHPYLQEWVNYFSLASAWYKAQNWKEVG